ncbi:hypothetical protein TNCV_3296201 [Trichonephila clavipes]|uniref:Uncharacterized protein n=1 Tax=Trichonephila clavipes TaxID=2585209 RepID=A0A8X6T186_TRICX|nr:hypothetical protein TNCV_3296201 [Trichonephila clavipes]
MFGKNTDFLQSGMFARRLILRLHLTRNHRCEWRIHQWCDEPDGQWNGMTLCLVTNPLLSAASSWLDSSLETPW